MDAGETLAQCHPNAQLEAHLVIVPCSFLTALFVASRGNFLGYPCRVSWNQTKRKWTWESPSWYAFKARSRLLLRAFALTVLMTAGSARWGSIPLRPTLRIGWSKCSGCASGSGTSLTLVSPRCSLDWPRPSSFACMHACFAGKERHVSKKYVFPTTASQALREGPLIHFWTSLSTDRRSGTLSCGSF